MIKYTMKSLRESIGFQIVKGQEDFICNTNAQNLSYMLQVTEFVVFSCGFQSLVQVEGEEFVNLFM